MKKSSDSVKKTALLALCAAFSLMLSYVETLIPPLSASVPGIKMGLANIAIVFSLYRFGVKEAAAVSFLRLVLSTLLFGNPMTFIYSAAGAVLSLAAMAVLRRSDLFSTVGVSVAGAVMHNLGQILTAMLLLETAALGYYMLVLAVTGTVSGILVGLCSALLIKRLEKFGGLA